MTRPRYTRSSAVTLAMALALWAMTPAMAAAPTAPALHFTNPLVSPRTHRPMVCPDPDVIAAHRGRWRYFMVCTSALAPNAFPIYKSRDLVHWYRDGFVFPRHRQPWWALPSPKGAYWAPEIYRIENRWIVYFSARINRRAHPLPGVHLPGNTMVLGAAESTALKGPWHTRILHYRGQFN